MDPRHASRRRGPSCHLVREAVSARMDGEVAALPASDERAHLDRCEGCRRFAARVASLDRQVGSGTLRAPDLRAPDLRAEVLAAVAEDRAGADARRLRDLRWVVAVAGLAQLVVATPFLLGVGVGGGHLGRDLGALQLALGVGLVLAARQPYRAHGVLPVAAVVAGAVLVTAVVDLAAGRVSPLLELTHLTELVGVLALWALTRRLPASGGAVRHGALGAA